MKFTKHTLTLLVLLFSSSAVFAQEFKEDAYYRLTTKWQGEDKSLDIINDGKNITPILAKTGQYSGQMWKITKVGEDTYTLTTAWRGPELKLDCIQGPNQNRPVLNKSNYSGTAWKIKPLGYGYYQITNSWLSDRSLDIINDGENNKIQVAKTGNYSGQKWKITEIPAEKKTNTGYKPQVTVSSSIKCQVAMINLAKLEDEGDWWSAWHDIKSAKTYKETPCSFDLEPGSYVMVAYNPASVNYDPNNGNPLEASDGVILEEIAVGSGVMNIQLKQEDFKDWNCLSCPWLYAFDGKEYVKLEEVIQDVVGEANCQTTTHQISSRFIVDGKLNIRIQEEKEETSYLDQVSLVVDGERILPVEKKLVQTDKDYLVLEKGEFVELTFDLSEIAGDEPELILDCTGFYIPDQEFLNNVYEEYLITRED